MGAGEASAEVSSSRYNLPPFLNKSLCIGLKGCRLILGKSLVRPLVALSRLECEGGEARAISASVGLRVGSRFTVDRGGARWELEGIGPV